MHPSRRSIINLYEDPTSECASLRPKDPSILSMLVVLLRISISAGSVPLHKPYSCIGPGTMDGTNLIHSQIRWFSDIYVVDCVTAAHISIMRQPA